MFRPSTVWGWTAPPPRFRTIQVWPKDLPAALQQAEHAVNRASGPVATTPDDRGGSPHVRHEAARVHHAPRRRGGLAARGTRAAGRADAAHRCADAIRRE